MSKERIKEIPAEVDEKKIGACFDLGKPLIYPKGVTVILSDPGDEQTHVRNDNDSKRNTAMR